MGRPFPHAAFMTAEWCVLEAAGNMLFLGLAGGHPELGQVWPQSPVP